MDDALDLLHRHGFTKQAVEGVLLIGGGERLLHEVLDAGDIPLAAGMAELQDVLAIMTMHGLADYWVYSFAFAADGGVWIGTWNGANRFDPATKTFAILAGSARPAFFRGEDLRTLARIAAARRRGFARDIVFARRLVSGRSSAARLECQT